MQLPFDFPHKPSFHKSDFLISNRNQATCSVLMDRACVHPRIYLCGERSTGKSHLAHIWAEHNQGRIIDAISLRVDKLDISADQAIAVEDIDQLINEKALFHLINLTREHKIPLLVTARTPAKALPFALKDLGSRLQAMPLFMLYPLPDQQLDALLAKLLADRQIESSQNLITTILNLADRRVEALVKFVMQIDYTSLVEKRPPSKAMIKNLLNQELSQADKIDNQANQGELFNL